MQQNSNCYTCRDLASGMCYRPSGEEEGRGVLCPLPQKFSVNMLFFSKSPFNVSFLKEVIKNVHENRDMVKHELRVTNYKLQVTSYKLLVTS